jgi:hypothetical protein
VGPGPAESATGLMKKMPHRGGDTQVQPHTVERRARFYAVRPSRRAISSSRSRRSGLTELRQVENPSSDGHATPMSTVSWPRHFGPEAAARPSADLTVFLETTWPTILQGLPECLRCLVAVRSTHYFASCVLPSSGSGLPHFDAAGRPPEESGVRQTSSTTTNGQWPLQEWWSPIMPPVAP